MGIALRRRLEAVCGLHAVTHVVFGNVGAACA
jgi:hypothetical protein